MVNYAGRVDAYFDELVEAVSDGDTDAAELARLIHAVQDELAKHEASTCSVEQEKLLVLASMKLLDEPPEIAPLLVGNYLFDINTVARAVVDSALALPPNAQSRLLDKLQVRGLVLSLVNVPRDSKWFERLCSDLPTLQVLQQRPWKQLKEILESTAGMEALPTPSEALGVQQVWSLGDELREKVLQYGLPADFADIFTSRGCQSVQELTELDVTELQHGRSDDEKSNLRRLWRCESAQGKADAIQAAQQRETLARQISQVIGAIGTLKHDAEAGQVEAVENKSKELGELMTALGLGELTLPIKDLKSLDELDSMLGKVANELKSRGE
ncbi:unnamed protein product [Aphanomyces euteiches]